MSIGHTSRLIGAVSGWPRNVIAFVCGAICTLTLAPFHLFPFVIASFTGLIWLLQGAHSYRRAFWDGWWWGWGFFITSLYWICEALLTDEAFTWLIPFALFGLTAIIAIYPAIACWGSARLKLRGIVNIIAFSVIWTVVEFARGHLFTGFPWNLAGYSIGFSDASLQLAYVFGAYGLTFIAVLLGSSFAILGNASFSSKRQWIFLVVIWGVFAGGVGWGGWRLQVADKIPENERFVEGVNLRLVQGNISQSHKWKPELQQKGLNIHLMLTQKPGIENITHIIWPETAVPYALKENTGFTQALGNAIPEGKILITGALRLEGEKKHWKVWNSLDAVDHNGDIVGVYDKNKLVPFGEFIPFRFLLPDFLLTPAGDMDFERGSGLVTASWPGLPPFSPLICYEVIFPSEVVAKGDPKPQWILNITNDAWFGTSIGPYQHFDMSRMRAVEEGIPLVRVANTGITAVFDSFGRVQGIIPLGEQGVLDVGLPTSGNGL